MQRRSMLFLLAVCALCAVIYVQTAFPSGPVSSSKADEDDESARHRPLPSPPAQQATQPRLKDAPPDPQPAHKPAAAVSPARRAPRRRDDWCETSGGSWGAGSLWRSDAAATCAWAANVSSEAECLPRKEPKGTVPALPPRFAGYAPLAGGVFSFIGDSTHAETYDMIAMCLTGEYPTRYPDVRLPDGAGEFRIRFTRSNFARDLLGALITPHACIRGDRVPEMRLKDALSSSQMFSRALGDAVVLGAGLWNLGKDHASSTQDNGGHVRYADPEDVLANYLAEVANVTAWFSAQTEPWRSELLSRTFWRGMYATETTNYPGQRNEYIRRGNEGAAALWAAIGGRPPINVYKYTADESPNPTPGEPRHTRDGVHAHNTPCILAVRDIMSHLVHAELPLHATTLDPVVACVK